MTSAERTDAAALDTVRASPHGKVKVAITDIDGVLRGKYIHRDKFFSAVENGFGFCNVVFGWDCADACYDNTAYTGWHTGYPDAQVRLDLSTLRTIPWEDNVPFVMGEFVHGEGEPLPVCPRQVLKRVLNRLKAAGLQAHLGVEYEWFNFRETPQTLADKGYQNPEPLTPGMFGYSILRSSYEGDYFSALMDQLAAFEVPLEGLHTETGPGVYEAAIMASGALEAADRAILFKSGVKEIAYRHGIVPSFMAKWNATLPGCSGHLHQSLWDLKGTTNLFYDKGASYGMSETFRHFLAGQMQLLPELLVMFAPTVNSYKRLVEGLWAPTRVTWGADNRTAAFRVIPGRPSATRLETRVAGADLNPYLALAAALGSGLYGIKKELEAPTRAVEGNAYEARSAPTLPPSLSEATEAFARSEVARELFGESFVEHYAATRRWEWREFQKAVTSWELERYFEII